MITWRRIVQQYECEVCMAGPGEPCKTYSGEMKMEPHSARSNLARANNWAEL